MQLVATMVQCAKVCVVKICAAYHAVSANSCEFAQQWKIMYNILLPQQWSGGCSCIFLCTEYAGYAVRTSPRVMPHGLIPTYTLYSLSHKARN